MKKLNDAVSKEVVKNTEFNTVKTKVNHLKINRVVTTFIHINQYNTDKENLEKKIGDVNKNYLTLVV